MTGLPEVMIVPLAGALLGAAGAWLLPNRMRPAVAARIVTAREVGDRHLIARALARAALAQPNVNFGLLGMADTGVIARVEALLEPPPATRRVVESAYAVAAGCPAVLLLLSIAQVHHWLNYALGLCWPPSAADARQTHKKRYTPLDDALPRFYNYNA